MYLRVYPPLQFHRFGGLGCFKEPVPIKEFHNYEFHWWVLASHGHIVVPGAFPLAKHYNLVETVNTWVYFEHENMQVMHVWLAGTEFTPCPSFPFWPPGGDNKIILWSCTRGWRDVEQNVQNTVYHHPRDSILLFLHIHTCHGANVQACPKSSERPGHSSEPLVPQPGVLTEGSLHYLSKCIWSFEYNKTSSLRSGVHQLACAECCSLIRAPPTR